MPEKLTLGEYVNEPSLLSVTTPLSAPSTRLAPAQVTPDDGSPPQWMQIHVPGSRMDYLVGPGHGWVPAITLADISEAPITKVISHPPAP